MASLPLLRAAAAAPPGAGGSDDVHICLLAPHGEADPGGRVRAVLPLERPSIFAADPLVELRLEQAGRVLWQREAPPLRPIEGPQPWPLRPVRGGERLLLRLRPLGEPRGRFASVELEAAPEAVLRRNETLRNGLGRDGRLWQQAVEQAMERRDAPLVAALLFAFEGPSAPSLNDLRLTAFQQGCGTPASATMPLDPAPAP